MSCTNCGNGPTSYSFDRTPCRTSTSLNSCCSSDSSNITYSGPNLTNIDVSSNSDLQTILSSIDSTIGGIAGADWSSFDYSCLSEGYTINSAQTFAESISDYVCTLSTSFDSFQSSTFADSISALQTSIDTINDPGYTSCEAVGIVDTDNGVQVTTKIINNLCTIYDLLDVSTVDWAGCLTPSPIPDNLISALNIIQNQICSVKAVADAAAVLPTFDNSDTCLSISGTTDSLYDTVVALTDKVCSSVYFNIDDLSWGSCIDNPNPGGGSDITSALNLMLNYIKNVFSLRIVSWDSDFFDVTYTDPENTCSGYNVTLQSGVGLSDKLVALDSGDTNPGYLTEKLTAGTNIEFDLISNPGSITINSTAEDVKVKANSGDASSGYLIDKVAGTSDVDGIISISESYNATTDKVDLTPIINVGQLSAKILSAISDSDSLKAILCALTCNCNCDLTVRTVTYTITNSGITNLTMRVVGTQTTPTVSWYDSTVATFLAGTTYSSGAFAATSASIPLSGTITLYNNNIGADVDYSITVVDGDDNPVSGSTSVSGTILAGESTSISPMVYGNVADMRVIIDISKSPDTTTTTTTSTTTGA